MAKVILITGLLTAMVIGCCGQQKDVNIDNDTVAINDILNDYAESIELADTNLCSDLIAHDSGLVDFWVFGRPIRGWDQLKEVIVTQDAALDSVDILSSDRRVHIAACGDIAWATSLWNFKGVAAGAPVQLPVRCTFVLRKDDDRWRIVHFHNSIAVQ